MSDSEDAATDLIRELTTELNAGHYEAVADFFVADYVDRFDNESVQEILRKERERDEAFAEKHEAIDTILTDTDHTDGTQLSVWYTVTGTHEGEFLHLPPTGNQVEFPLLRVVTIEDGQITRYRLVYTLGFLLDLGLDWEQLTEQVNTQQFLTSPDAARG